MTAIVPSQGALKHLVEEDAQYEMKNTATATEGALTPSSRSHDHARDEPTLDRQDHAGMGLDMTRIHKDDTPHDRHPNFPTSERGAEPGKTPTDRNHPGKGRSGAPTSPDSATPGRATGCMTPSVAVGEDEATWREGSPADDPPSMLEHVLTLAV